MPITHRRKSLGNAALAGLAVVTLGSVGFVLADGATSQTTAVPSSVQTYYDENVAKAAPTVAPVRFAAVGDSITEANSLNFVGGTIGDGSWVHYVESKEYRFAGGWADGGAETVAMVDGMSPVAADVLVILAGTNDLGHGVPFDETTENISAIVERSGVSRVVVSTIPPQNDRPAAVTKFNANLQAFVKSNGWGWVDGPAGVREGERFKPGMTTDGTHPTPAASRIIGETIREALKG